MDNGQFEVEMGRLEGAYPSPRPKVDQEVEARWVAVFDLVKQFKIEVFREARLRLTRRPGFMPNAGQIFEACEEIAAEGRILKIPQRAGTLVAHTCAPPIAQGDAYAMLAGLTSYGAAGYEARHVACPVVQATCPKCGKQHVAVNPLIVELKGRYPEETADWNTAFKGYLLCSNCTEART